MFRCIQACAFGFLLPFVLEHRLVWRVGIAKLTAVVYLLFNVSEDKTASGALVLHDANNPRGIRGNPACPQALPQVSVFV